MATAENAYVDPSALSRLYIHHEEGSIEMARWRRRAKGSVLITHHGEVEIANAIALGVFRGVLHPDDAKVAWALLESDLVNGHLRRAEFLWRSALNRAVELSKDYSSKFGTRTLDVLHVACALELGLRYFLTFDERQERLAKAVGLKAVKLQEV